MVRRCAAWGFGLLLGVAFLNSVAFDVYATSIGGASVYEQDGRHFVNSHGRYTEVSEDQAEWVQTHRRAVMVTYAVFFAVGVPLLLLAVRNPRPQRHAEPGAAADTGRR